METRNIASNQQRGKHQFLHEYQVLRTLAAQNSPTTIDLIALNQQLKNASDDMLILACIERDEALRDAAISCGADAGAHLLCFIGSLWSYRSDTGLAPLEQRKEYIAVKFILESEHAIDINETTSKMAAETSAKVFALLLEHWHTRHFQLFTWSNIHDMVGDPVIIFGYLLTHDIDVLLEKKYLSAALCNFCTHHLNMKPIDFYASTGDEMELANFITEASRESATLYDNIIAGYALYHACTFNRENTALQLIKAGVDVNFSYIPGSFLTTAIENKHVNIVKLLLNCEQIDISIVPHNKNKSLYTLGMHSDSEDIKQLFVNKQNEISQQIQETYTKIQKEIDRLIQESNTFFGFGCAQKAKRISAALNRAWVAGLDGQIFLSVDQFLNFSLQGELSIKDALAQNRINPWATPHSTVNVFPETLTPKPSK